MRFELADDDLQRVYEDPAAGVARYGRDLVRSLRKVVQVIDAASTSQDLRAMRSLRLEKLSGDHAGLHSVRLNRQWRLLLRLEDRDGEFVVVVKIADYH